MKIKAFPSWVTPVRVVGAMLGASFVFGALVMHSLGSDAQPPPTEAQLLLKRCLFAIAALPLVAPWRSIRHHGVRRILLVLLAGDALYFTYDSISSVAWVFQYGERSQIAPFILSGIAIIVILCAQFPAILRLTNTHQTNVA